MTYLYLTGFAKNFRGEQLLHENGHSVTIVAKKPKIKDGKIKD